MDKEEKMREALDIAYDVVEEAKDKVLEAYNELRELQEHLEEALTFVSEMKNE